MIQLSVPASTSSAFPLFSSLFSFLSYPQCCCSTYKPTIHVQTQFPIHHRRNYNRQRIKIHQPRFWGQRQRPCLWYISKLLFHPRLGIHKKKKKKLNLNLFCFLTVRLVNSEHRIGIFACKNIKPGTELLLDYGSDFFFKTQTISISTTEKNWLPPRFRYLKSFRVFNQSNKGQVFQESCCFFLFFFVFFFW